MPDRAIAPAIGVVLLVAITVTLAGVVLAMGLTVSPGSAQTATVEGSLNHTANAITLVHTGGDPIDLEEADIRISVDGTPLTHQPPVPYWNPDGFQGFPSGPFNPSSENTWESGERGTIRLDTDNEPLPNANATVEVAVIGEAGPIARTTIRPE